MPVITIRGRYGSDAPEIGEWIAKELGIDYVDQKIIADVATRLSTSNQRIAEKEMPPSTLLGRIAADIRNSYFFSAGDLIIYQPLVEMPLDDKNYLAGLTYVITEMAKCQAIVIRGRGSQFILKDVPGVFHILVVTPVEKRIKRVMTEMGLDEKAAREETKRLDSNLREFFKRYFQADTDDPVHYDLVINTAHFSVEAASQIALNAMRFIC
jgi:hypothetical protein